MQTIHIGKEGKKIGGRGREGTEEEKRYSLKIVGSVQTIKKKKQVLEEITMSCLKCS